MNISFEILYKNGLSDILTQEVTEEVLSEIRSPFIKSFQEGYSAFSRFSNGAEENLIRVADVSRIKITKLSKEEQ